MKKIFVALVLLAGFSASAQIKIGANPTSLNDGSLLELESSTKGLKFPEVALTSTIAWLPLAGTKVMGMTVYNTATAGDVTPGLYTNNGSVWVKNEGGASSNLYTSDGTLVATRTVTQNNNDLTFTTGTGKTIVNGTFKTTGAVYGKVRTVTSLTTSDWATSDYAIILTVPGLTINLPDASSAVNEGRIIFVANESGAPSTYGGADDKFKPVNVTTISPARGQQIICLGGLWHLISGVKN